jgi:hypothetical protein
MFADDKHLDAGLLEQTAQQVCLYGVSGFVYANRRLGVGHTKVWLLCPAWRKRRCPGLPVT